jgi:hypothetical protein
LSGTGKIGPETGNYLSQLAPGNSFDMAAAGRLCPAPGDRPLAPKATSNPQMWNEWFSAADRILGMDRSAFSNYRRFG